jgi:hypothetical protein
MLYNIDISTHKGSSLSKSSQIRELAAQGKTVKECAEAVGVVYQFAYNVLKGKGSHATAIPKGLTRRSKPKLTIDADGNYDLTEVDESEADTIEERDAEYHWVTEMFRLEKHQSPFRPTVARYIGPRSPEARRDWVVARRGEGYIDQEEFEAHIGIIRGVLRKASAALSQKTVNDWDAKPAPRASNSTFNR